jgi:CPA2 family monovalent cation:H+ antiporter-2
VTGAVLGQVGEFSFILAAMGLSAHTINEDSYKYVVAIISLSLLVTPIWLYAVKRFKTLQKITFTRRKKNVPNSPM